jgi:hypothetical protein
LLGRIVGLSLALVLELVREPSGGGSVRHFGDFHRVLKEEFK